MLWQSVKKSFDLKEERVHVWRASLACSEERIVQFLDLLNEQEKERAAKFVVKDAANNFIVARAILRTLLGKYLSLDPKELVFQQNRYGKLYLQDSSLQFNLSHSHDLGLFIFALNTSVGVDVEFIRKDFKFHDIVERFFSKTEVIKLFSLPKDEQVLAFFNCWSRKEAFIKGLGLGVFKGLDKFSVEVSGKKVGKVFLSDSEDKQSGQNWALEAIDPGDQYTGALAINSQNYQINFYDFI